MAMIASMVPVSGRGAEEENAMDWCAWLSRARLAPELAYEYGLVFARNELEEEDIPHFDHEFLLSMGISVAKHRLEILKLAEEERRLRRRRRPRPVARLLAAADRTRQCLARCLRSLAGGVGGGGTGSSALAAVRRKPFGGGQWGIGAVLKGSGRLAAHKQGRLLLTDGSARAAGATPPPAARFGRRGSGKSGSGEDKVRRGAGGAGEVRWDSMFQDLKPT